MKLHITTIGSVLKKKFQLLSILVSVCFLGNFNNLIAQDKIEFTHLFENQSISGVTNMFQDKRGVIWIGTSNGLYTYDGIHLKQYINNFKDKASISDNLIRRIFEDRTGKIWVATSYGLNLYNADNDNFTHYFHENNNASGIPDNFVTSIIEDNQGDLWIAAKYLCRYNRDKNDFTTFKTNLGDKYNGIYKSHYTFLFVDNKDNLWFCAWDKLYVFDKKNNTYNCLLSNDDLGGNGEAVFNSLIQDKDGVYWVLANKSGLYSFRFSDKIYNLECHDYDKKSPIHLRDFAKSQIKEDNIGNLWIGTENGGVFQYNKATGRFFNYTNNSDDGTSISNNSIWSVFVDKEGRVWLGHHVRGISVIDPYFKKFEHIHTGVFQKKLSNNDVAAILEDNSGNLWIGTDGGGLNYYNKQKDKFTYYKNDPKNSGSISKDAVISLCIDVKDNLWVGTWDGGINILKKGGNSFTKLNTQNSVLGDNDIYALVSDNKGKVYIGSYGNGLYIFDVYTNKWENYIHNDSNSNSLINNHIFSLYVDKENSIWIGTFNTGADRLQFDTEGNAHFTHFQPNTNDSLSLSNNYIQTFFEEEDGTFWIGTRNGLNKLDKKTGKFKIYRTEDGLPSNSIKAILNDKHGNLWISTLNGISKFDKSKKTFRNYSINDGLQGDIFHRNSAFKSKSGNMYFGGANGYNVFNPDSIKDNPYPPKIIFTDFKIFNKTVPIGKNSVLQKHINETRELTLTYEHTVFTFEFAALNYTHPEKNQYAFMLEGLEKEWNYVGYQKNATYTNLDPGYYTFRVKAANNDGVWNEQGISITIKVTPPYWKTGWFRLGVLILIFGGTVFFVKRRINYLKKQKILLENLVYDRTSELAESNEQLVESFEEIHLQKEELDAQNESLISTNKILEEQKLFIEKQNIEIDNHRLHLENMVDERTKELSIALKKAEESDKLKTAFLANMSHEIRTPMNAIIGFSSLLSEPVLSDNERNEFIDMIKKNGESLLFLINDIIDLSKIQTKQIAIFPKAVSINSLLDEIFKLFGLIAKQKNLELILNYDITGNDIVVLSDPERLKQILTNLISNAIKYTEKGFVEIGIKQTEDEFLTFFVKDTGVGVAKDVEDKLFGIFNKIEISNKKLYRGLGLGLPLCKSLAELLGGNIWHESEVGKGSVFYFTIPNQQVEPEEKSSSSIIAQLDLTGKTLLIAEDQESNYELLSYYLYNTGAKILWFEDGESIVEYIKSNGVADLILMDIKMPGMDGITATKLIKEIRSDIPIIAQTAFASAEERNIYASVGFFDYLTKPIYKNALFMAIGAILNK